MIQSTNIISTTKSKHNCVGGDIPLEERRLGREIIIKQF